MYCIIAVSLFPSLPGVSPYCLSLRTHSPYKPRYSCPSPPYIVHTCVLLSIQFPPRGAAIRPYEKCTTPSYLGNVGIFVTQPMPNAANQRPGMVTVWAERLVCSWRGMSRGGQVRSRPGRCNSVVCGSALCLLFTFAYCTILWYVCGMGWEDTGIWNLLRLIRGFR